MRPIAVGRKNWIHVGSVEAGPKVAAILSVVETCKRLGIPVREYLADVLPGMGGQEGVRGRRTDADGVEVPSASLIYARADRNHGVGRTLTLLAR